MTTLNYRSRQFKDSRYIAAVCSVLAVLLPIHPSFQKLWIVVNVPSYVGSVVLFLPALVLFSRVASVTKRDLNVFLLFLVWAALLLITSGFSPALGLANWRDSARGLGLILPFVLFSALIAAKSQDASAKVIIGLGLVVLMNYCYLLATGGAVGSGFWRFGGVAEIGGAKNYQSTSLYLGFVGIWLLAVGQVQLRESRWVWFFLAFIFVLMASTGGRSAILALSFCILVSFRKQWRFLALAGALGVFATAVFIIWCIISGLDEKIVDALSRVTLFERVIELFSGVDRSHRLNLYSKAVEIWVESPSNFLFGVGLGAFPVVAGFDPSAGWYPHNFILESLAEGGIIASVPLFVVLWRFISGFSRESPLEFNRLFFQYFALYGLCSFMFMGGLASAWIPCFALALHFFTFTQLKND